MKLLAFGAGLIGAVLLMAPGAGRAASLAGTPLTPSDAAGPWTLESSGRTLCVLSLGRDKSAAGYALKVPASCGDAVPATVAAWAPEPDGMKFISADGQTVIGFNRWSDSLLVSHRSSGAEVQLKRGPPNSY